MISGWSETWFFREVFVTVGKNARKPGFWGILTADVGGCTLMDADDLVLSWTYGFVETWFFPEVFVSVGKNANKPGFWGILTARLVINLAFMRILGYSAKRWEKTRFMKVFNRRFSC
ncbi:hypothetical protein [Microcoleus sp. OTE_8_concoct_300]|uniref:hypothetical protein n=1 Tax=Microcoleus sp. OTE_8_concoct_300 TaxID=2964710 RepID=UPI00403F25FC